MLFSCAGDIRPALTAWVALPLAATARPLVSVGYEPSGLACPRLASALRLAVFGVAMGVYSRQRVTRLTVW